MLRTIHTMEELDISGWMEVYREGHEENGAYFYPDEPPERALHLAEEDSRRFLEGFFQIPGAQYWIWEEEGRYVSCLRLKPDRDGLLLEALETRPDCRRRGFGKQLILSVLSHLPRGTKIYSKKISRLWRFIESAAFPRFWTMDCRRTEARRITA
mgnify:CR=1 FL=1